MMVNIWIGWRARARGVIAADVDARADRRFAPSDIVICPMFEPFVGEATTPSWFTRDFARRAVETLARQFRKY